MRKTVLLMAALIAGFVTTGVAQTAGPTLKKITAFDLPGPAGKRFDYLTIDEDDHYLISAHLAAGQTYVIDLGTNKVVAVITSTPGNERSKHPVLLSNSRHSAFVLGAFGEETSVAFERLTTDG